MQRATKLDATSRSRGCTEAAMGTSKSLNRNSTKLVSGSTSPLKKPATRWFCVRGASRQSYRRSTRIRLTRSSKTTSVMIISNRQQSIFTTFENNLMQPIMSLPTNQSLHSLCARIIVRVLRNALSRAYGTYTTTCTRSQSPALLFRGHRVPIRKCVLVC